MIDDYLGEDGQKALALTGWPEWDQTFPGLPKPIVRRGVLGEDPNGWCVFMRREDTGQLAKLYDIHPHVALCILRDWFRENLQAQHRQIGVQGGPQTGYYVRVFRRGPIPIDESLASGPDYDRALIAAALAGEKR